MIENRKIKIKNRRKIISAILVICLIVYIINNLTIEYVFAAEKNARLKNCLQKENLYYATSIDLLNTNVRMNKSGFESTYGNRFVAIKGRIQYGSVKSDGKQTTLFSGISGNFVVVDTSDDRTCFIAKNLKAGDQVVVYGKVVTDLISNSYKIEAHRLVKGDVSLQDRTYASIDGGVYSSKENDLLTHDKHLKMYIPVAWQNQYVCSELKNNDVKGYQYCLNVLNPINTKYPEIFYVFYFINETYTKTPPSSLDNYKEVEKLIIYNILQKTDKDLKVNISEFKDTLGNEWDYYTTPYRPKDGNDYRLEFLFKPDENGIVCMLYLYYPKEGEVNHTNEVAYVISTMNDSIALKR